MSSCDSIPQADALNERSSTDRGVFDCRTTPALGLSADTKVGYSPTPK